ncbi:MAG: TonB-dependent receptor plug domain-containing protein [Porticoccaceae bacterium]
MIGQLTCRTLMPTLAKLALAASVAMGISTAIQAQETEQQRRQSITSIEEVVVTARRREESLQAVPLAINAFSGQRLQEATAFTLSDMTALAPGLRFTTEGGKNTTNVTMRGLSHIPVGEGVPPVVLYFNETPLPSRGINLPIYDIENIQVLKGPQGTLFGRNTLAGALLLTSRKPTYDYEGFVQGTVGNYNLNGVEGAINVPLVDDTLAARLAFQKRDRDGVTRNMSRQTNPQGRHDFDDIAQESVRLSILFDPTDSLSNTLVLDHFVAKEQPGGLHIERYNPGLIGDPTLERIVEDYAIAQRQAGAHRVFSNQDRPRENRRTLGAINTTELNLTDSVLVKNIFSYRKAKIESQINTGGTGPLPGDFVLFHAGTLSERQYLTNELQLQGTSFDDRLEWIVGGFYSNDKSYGPGGLVFRIFSPADAPLSYGTAHEDNTSKAVFGQIGLDISQWTVDGMTFNLGYRHTWDEQETCGGAAPGGFVSESRCRSLAGLNLPDGIGVGRFSSNAPAYTVGLDWQLNDNLFLFAVHRHGFRSGGLNNPQFETEVTTGGSGCAMAGQPVQCPDLRPFQARDEEKVDDFEVGFKSDWQFDNGMYGRLNASYFYMEYTDAVQFFNPILNGGVPSDAPDAPVSALGINVGSFTIQGLELEASVSPIPTLTFSVNGAYVDQGIDSISESPFGAVEKSTITLPTPKISGTLAVRWELPYRPLDSDLIFNADYYYTDEWTAQVGIPLPGYQVANTRLDFQNIANSGVDLGLWIRNAFDKEYRSAPNYLGRDFPVNTVFYGEPRTWGIDIRYSW